MKNLNNSKPTEDSTLLPTAVVLASSTINGELLEIFGVQESSSLVLAGRTIIEHVLLELHEFGFEQCIILAGRNAESVQALVENNGSWEMTVNVMNYSCSKEQVLNEFKSLSDPSGMLIVETDKLRGHCVKAFLNEANHSEYSLLEAVCAQGKAGLTLLKPTQSDFIVNAMPLYIDGLRLNFLRSARDFHRGNLELVSGGFSGLKPSVALNKKHNRRQHWASNVSSKEDIDWSQVMIEQHCQVGRRVKLDSVVINHDVYIDDKSEIRSAVLMPNQMISSKQLLNDVIVNEGVIYQL